MEKEKEFRSWAVVELMGHSVTAGFVSEEVIAGTPLLRVDVPECDGLPAVTQFYGGSAIYRLTPCTEEMAKSVVRNRVMRADVQILGFRLELPSASGSFGHEKFDDVDDEG